jgi:tetratricopeptide (TPR) repeat protein
MKRSLLLTAFLITGLWLFAQDAEVVEDTPASADAGPVVVSTANYQITHPSDQAAAEEIGAIMENYLQLYNAFFLKNLSQFAENPLKVEVLADQASFTSRVQRETGEERSDFVYLHYSNPDDSVLLIYEGADNRVNQLGFQGFIQFLWNILPNTPAWLQEGFAYQFWDYEWKNGQLYPRGQFPFLSKVKTIFTDGTLDLQTLLDSPSGTGSEDYAHLSWGLVYFLTQSTKPAYIRLTGTISASLSADADLETNQAAVMSPITNAGGVANLETDLKAFIDEMESLSSLLTNGIDKIRAEDFEGARADFTAAKAVAPASYLPDYYIALSYYEEEDYANAKTFFANLEAEDTPVGLLPYVQALTSYNLGEYEEAATLVAQAKEQNPEKYGDLADKLLEMLE